MAMPSSADGFLPAQPGEVIAAKYRIEQLIASGGMGVVMLARHLELGTPVAVKILKPEVCRDADAMARFLREARTAAHLQNEHVARVHDTGQLPSGEPFMVLEYLHGNDLADLVDSQGPQAVSDSVDYVLQALEALAEAHRNGIVHRDIKPPNLFLASRGDGSYVVKVLDFGISKGFGLDGRSEGAITNTSQIVGSPGYMSPEQLHNPRAVDVRTDIWSIGVVLDELLTAERFFEGETMGQTMANILGMPIRSVRVVRPDVPEELERIILRCLERDQNARFADVGELSRALAPFASPYGQLCAERAVGILSGPAPAPVRPGSMVDLPSHTIGSWTGATRSAARNPLTLAVALGVVAGFAITAVAYFRLIASDDLPEGATAAAPVEAVPAGPAVAPVAPKPAPAETRDAVAPTPSASASASSVASSAKPPPTPARPAGGYPKNPKTRYPDALLRERD